MAIQLLDDGTRLVGTFSMYRNMFVLFILSLVGLAIAAIGVHTHRNWGWEWRRLRDIDCNIDRREECTHNDDVRQCRTVSTHACRHTIDGTANVLLKSYDSRTSIPRTGHDVKVFYSPDDPQHQASLTSPSRITLIVVGALMVVGCATIGVMLFLSRNNSTAQRLMGVDALLNLLPSRSRDTSYRS